MHERNMDVIRLWYWIKVRCESAARLDPLRRLYGEEIRSLNLKAGGSLIKYIE